MKKLLNTFCVLLAFVISIGVEALADNQVSNRIYAILSTVLSDPATHTEFFSDNAYQSVVSQIEAEGFTLSDDFINQGTLYTYDASMSLLEVEWGPYHFWNIEQKHLFDQLMVSIGQLPYCFNLLPANGEISQEAALELAILEVNDQYGVAQEDLWATEQLIFSYYIADTDSLNGMWRINIQIAQGESFSVHVFNGRVIHCAKDQYISDLEKEYNSLCASKGAFFTWSLYDKMTFAQSLPEKLAQAERSNTLLMSETELRAIADYGFCLPTSDCIDQNAAYELARNAVTDQYALTESWETQAEVYYSFFFQPDDGYTWRVIFWKTGVTDYSSGVVDLDASSGEVLRVEKNGTKPNEYIPLVDRL